MAALIEITEADDPRLSDYRDLRDVQLRTSLESERGLFIAEGEKVIGRALAAGLAPRSFLLAARWLPGLQRWLDQFDVPCYVVTEALAEAVSGFHVHRGALASMHRGPLPSVAELLAKLPQGRRRIAVLEALVDHGNVGSIFRNAAAFGVDAVVVTPQCADPLYRRAVKTSMGNVFNVPWTRGGDDVEALIAELRAAGLSTAALTLSPDAVPLHDFAPGPAALALVFGTEGAGVSPAAARACDVRVTIPMQAGVDSLNVAAASAVSFYALQN